MLEAMAATETGTLAAEYQALREGCALVDRSARGKLALSGAGAVEFLNGQVTNELADLQAGEGRYAAFLTPKGKMLGDVRILAVAPVARPSAAPETRDAEPDGAAPDGSQVDRANAPAELLLDTERSALQALFDMVRRYKIGFEVELHKRTIERGLLSLIGPGSAATAGAEWLAEAGEHVNAPLAVGAVQALAVRSDVGVDLVCDAADTERLRETLLARGALAASEHAAECLRVERGRPRYGLDIDDTTIPQEAGLNERAVSFTKGCYVGQETVARLHYKGKPNRHLRGLRLSAPAATGEQLRLGERVVGTLGSSVVSPQLGSIALALVRREAEPGATLDVGDAGTSALVVDLPFER
jgi:folate-binding protein YgfZ